MSSLSTFDPKSLDLDIYIQDVKGLGRGRGFERINRRSALRVASITEAVKKRLLDLAALLYADGSLSEHDLLGRLGLQDERDALTANLEETERELKYEKAKVQQWHDGIVNLTGAVARALGEDPEAWWVEEEGELATLRAGIERLIEEFGAMKATMEEEGL